MRIDVALGSKWSLKSQYGGLKHQFRHSGSREATIRNLERNNSLLDTGSRLRLVRYDVWDRFQAF